MTLSDLVDYIVKKKGLKVFHDRERDQIAVECLSAIEKETLFFSSENGKITGMILATKLSDGVVWVDECIADNINIVKEFMRLWISKHKERTVKFKRRGKTKTYNLNNILKHI